MYLKIFISLLTIFSFAFSEIVPTIQQGHSSTIYSMQISPNKKFLISGDYNKKIIVWDIKTLKILKTINTPNQVFTISNDSNYIISGYGKGSISVLGIKRGKTIKSLNSKSSSYIFLTSIDIDKENKKIIFSNSIGEVKLWLLDKNKVLTLLLGKETSFVKFSKNENYVYIGDKKGLKILDIKKKKIIKSFQDNKSYKYDIDEDNNIYVSYNYDKELKIKKLTNGKLMRKIAFKYPMENLKIIKEKKFIILASYNEVILLDYKGKIIKVYKEHLKHSFAFLNNKLYLGSKTGSITKIDYITDEIEKINLSSQQTTSAYFDKSVDNIFYKTDDRIIFSTSDNYITYINLKTGEIYNKFKPLNHSIRCIDKRFDKEVIATAFSIYYKRDIFSKTIKINPIKKGVLASYVHCVKISPEGKEFAVAGTSSIYKAGKTPEFVHQYGITAMSVDYSPDGKKIVFGGSTYIYIYDRKTNKLIKKLGKFKNWVNYIKFSKDSNLFVSRNRDGEINIWDTKNWKILKKLKGIHTDFTPIDFSHNLLAYQYKNYIYVYDTPFLNLLKKIKLNKQNIFRIFVINKNNIAVVYTDSVVSIFSLKTGKEKVKFFVFPTASITITPEGYFTGKGNYQDYIHVVDTEKLKVYTFDQYYETFYRPDIVKLALQGINTKIIAKLDINNIKPAPTVEIINTPTKTNKNTITITLKITDQGGGIGDIRLYNNGSAILSDNTRSISIKTKKNIQIKKYTIKLTNGTNNIKAYAFNNTNTMMSLPANHTINAKLKTLEKPSLYAVIIGINQYKNQKLNLNYAVADAKIFAKTIRTISDPLFKEINITLLTTKENTTKQNIINTLKRMRDINPSDVFILFIASHGIVEKGEYFMLTSNVGSTWVEKLKKTALSQHTIKNLVANIPATKKLIIIDTCSAGALGKAIQTALLTRGLSEDTAMKILARAVGSTIISSSTSQQQALEGYKGHGLFTYFLVQGLKGEADLDRDSYIKTTEIIQYVDEKIPEVSEKIFNTQQYPTIDVNGQPFPIGRVK